MKKQWMKKRKALCSLVVACLFTLTVASAVSNATTINFDEYPGLINQNPVIPITTQYNSIGVTFGGDNAGIWGGISNGDLGNWGLEGTNGPAFLGNNGQNAYDMTIRFNTSVTSFSFDVSRSKGIATGQSLTWYAYEESVLRGSATIILGAINSWSTVSLNFSGNDFDKVVLDGSDTGFSPYGIDNLQFSFVAPVPEPTSLILLLAGIAGLAGLRSRRRS